MGSTYEDEINYYQGLFTLGYDIVGHLMYVIRVDIVHTSAFSEIFVDKVKMV